MGLKCRFLRVGVKMTISEKVSCLKRRSQRFLSGGRVRILRPNMVSSLSDAERLRLLIDHFQIYFMTLYDTT